LSRARRTLRQRLPTELAGDALMPIAAVPATSADLEAMHRATMGAACLAPNMKRITGPKVGALRMPTM
jgi:hypothetical protein